MEYRIDELARAGDTTVRNVRAYQDRGLLPPPRRQGRAGWYGEVHLARLRLIGGLLERGYTLANIAELLAAWERGQDLAELFGFETALVGPLSEETPQRFSAHQLLELFGTDIPPQALDEAITLGLLEGRGDDFVAPRPTTLRAAAELVGAGVPMDAVLALGRRLRADVDDIARAFVEAVDQHVILPLGDSLPPGDVARLAELIGRLRPMATSTVSAELANSLTREIQAQLSEHLVRQARDDRSGRAS